MGGSKDLMSCELLLLSGRLSDLPTCSVSTNP
jgi:hypothetical protein